MKDKVFAAVTAGVNEVMETMASLKLKASDHYTATESKALGQISVVIGLSGPTLKGAAITHFNKAMAVELAKKIFFSESDDVDDEVYDSVGEVANMVTGAIKRHAVEAGVTEFNITVPTIVVGNDYATSIQIKQNSEVFPFTSEDEQKNLTVELKIQFRE